MANTPKRTVRRPKPIPAYSRVHWDNVLEHDPRFLARIERARRSLREGKGTRLEDIKE